MKKLTLLILCLVMILALCSCGQKLTDAVTANSESSMKASAPSTQVESQDPLITDSPVVEAESMEETKSLDEDVIKEEPEDTLAKLEVSESFAKQTCGVFLKRGNKLFSLNGIVPYETGLRNDIGWNAWPASKVQAQIYNGFDDAVECISIGDIIVPTLDSSDLIVIYANNNIDVAAKALKVQFYGFTIPVIETKDSGVDQACILLTGLGNDPTVLSRTKFQTFEVRDKNGNVVDDRFDLHYDEEYTVSWYAGTQYNEKNYVANCRSYITDGTEYKLDYELTQNGYAILDCSQLESGLYRFGGGGIIEIP